MNCECKLRNEGENKVVLLHSFQLSAVICHVTLAVVERVIAQLDECRDVGRSNVVDGKPRIGLYNGNLKWIAFSFESVRAFLK
jgi:hypothetical protein